VTSTSKRLPEITARTVAGGRFDESAPRENLERLTDRIPESSLRFCDGGQLFVLQDAASWNAALSFLTDE
jgi:hypothetical protein